MKGHYISFAYDLKKAMIRQNAHSNDEIDKKGKVSIMKAKHPDTAKHFQGNKYLLIHSKNARFCDVECFVPHSTEVMRDPSIIKE